jgi:hypothetical protein
LPRFCVNFGKQIVGLQFRHFFPKLIWGLCYDHNFLRFFPIYGEKMAFFLKTNVMIIFFKI